MADPTREQIETPECPRADGFVSAGYADGENAVQDYLEGLALHERIPDELDKVEVAAEIVEMLAGLGWRPKDEMPEPAAEPVAYALYLRETGELIDLFTEAARTNLAAYGRSSTHQVVPLYARPETPAEQESDEARAMLDAALPMVKAVAEQVAERGEVAGHAMVDADLLFQLCSARTPGQEAEG